MGKKVLFVGGGFGHVSDKVFDILVRKGQVKVDSLEKVDKCRPAQRSRGLDESQYRKNLGGPVGES